MDHLAQPPQNSRGNGLDAGGWTRVVDVDPRLTDELLSLLADAAIAACAAPSPGERGVYLELRPPRRPVDRLYVDTARRADALALVRDRLGRPVGQLSGSASPSEQDAAFEAIVAGFGDPVGPVVWPDAENTGPDRTPDRRRDDPPRTVKPAGGLLDEGGLLYDSTLGDGNPSGDPFEDDDNHYVPPVPPPAPRWRTVTKAAIAAIVAGILLLASVPLGWVSDDQIAYAAGTLLILGGAASLVLHLGDDPPDDDGTRV